MNKLYRTALLAVFSCGILFSCSSDDSDDDCANYTGPALTKRSDGSCSYIDKEGSTVVMTDPQNCDCAK